MAILRALARACMAIIVLVGAMRPGASARRRPRMLPDPPAGRRAEPIVFVALLGAGAAGIAFIIVSITSTSTPLLGLCLALALGLLALALGVAGRALVPQERAVEERPARDAPGARADVEQLLAEGAQPLDRRRLVVAAGIAGCALGAAALTPLAALGPGLDDALARSPWRRGVALVDEHGIAIQAADLEIGSFLTAFPAGASKRDFAAPLVVVRIRVDELRLPPRRRGYAPAGLLAFSKICTHAGCAIALFRYPLSPATSGERPALVCPCHYSTFDVTRGAEPIFGPAVRALPQLPLRIDRRGGLVAAGRLTGRVGPSWWDVGEQ